MEKNLIRERIKEIDLDDDWFGTTPSFVDLLGRMLSEYDVMVSRGYKDISYSYNFEYNNYITFFGYREETDKELQARVNKIQKEHDREYQKFLELKAKFEQS